MIVTLETQSTNALRKSLTFYINIETFVYFGSTNKIFTHSSVSFPAMEHNYKLTYFVTFIRTPS